ncbi:bacteriocin immunity protein [Larsenimonas salina]|uniref:bacteriocin immunity protein n=1 Tax=Larsenimonas salina TaxID=1295565 RepID=UPI0020740809|nr:bacteriocin immunity protein [Larsenimonas salina]MCM5705815.1 bacteriocin immunity protein [Larsenimonas salina]
MDARDLFKPRFEDYTREEFMGLIKAIFDVESNIDIYYDLVSHFSIVSQHPDGSDLIFYPGDPEGVTPEIVFDQVVQWRKAHSLPGFKDV